jgi:predicted DNA binding protein/putative methionine-R-sulfoxide reductase with GAF domain
MATHRRSYRETETRADGVKDAFACQPNQSKIGRDTPLDGIPPARGEYQTVSQKASELFGHQPDHDHNLLLYESHEQQFASVAPYIQDGLDAGDRCAYFYHDNTRDEVVTALREKGVAVDAALNSGQLSLHPAGEIYLAGDDFDLEQMVDTLEQQISEVVDAGYNRLRTTGETTWATEYDVDLEQLKTYEREIDEFFPKDSLIGLCQYRRSQFSPEFLSYMLQTHPQVTHRAERRLNCYYDAPESHAADGSSPAVVDRKLKTISEQHRLADSLSERERSLSLLRQATDQLQEADPNEIDRIAGEILAESVDPALISLWRYDSETGQLRTQVTQNTIRGVECERVIDALGDRAWEVFAGNEPAEFDVETGEPVSGVVVPAGEHGVVLVGTPGPDGITEAEFDFVKTVTGHTKAVLDRVTYESHLEEKSDRLGEQNAKLQRVDRINTVLREINQSLVDATTATEVVKETCEQLVAETCLDFVWYGSYDPATETLTPKQEAGEGKGYLDALAVDGDRDTNEPSRSAARTGETEVVQNVYDGPTLEQWREYALKRDFQSVIALPVRFDDSMYGVLSLYCDTPEVFDDEIVTVLGELTDSVGHTLNSIKRKEALVTNAVAELEVRVTDTELPIVEFVSETDCRVDIDEVISVTDGGLRMFATFRDASLAEIQTFAATSPTVDEIEQLTQRESAYFCACSITDECVIAEVLSHSAVPQSIKVEDGEARMVLDLPRDERVRNFMEMVQTKYPSAEVVARRDRDRPLRRISDVEAQLADELTDRQLEILKLAYHGEYFERPRQQTAGEIADSLGVSRPTVSRHLREAERKVFSLLLDAE